MNKKKFTALAVIFAMAFTMCVYAFSPAAYALVSKKGSITLHVADTNTATPIEGASFRLYLFAAAYEKSGGVGYDYVVPYDDCKMDMGNLQDAYLPIHLTHFALTHELNFTFSTSDEKGSILFDNLVPGVYLIVPMGNIPDYFMPSPFVINIPLYDKENKNWVYDINATPKMQIYEAEGLPETTYISVKKVWNTDTSHPESVTVSLLCDFREAEKVTLSAANGWHYRWDNLSSKHVWSVVESEIPDGFKVSYESSSNSVKIINTGASVTGTTSPDEKPVTTHPDEPTTEPDELIDTGQFNWPVPVFSIAGLLLFSIGWAMLNISKKDEEAA